MSSRTLTGSLAVNSPVWSAKRTRMLSSGLLSLHNNVMKYSSHDIQIKINYDDNLKHTSCQAHLNPGVWVVREVMHRMALRLRRGRVSVPQTLRMIVPHSTLPKPLLHHHFELLISEHYMMIRMLRLLISDVTSHTMHIHIGTVI